MKENCTTLFLVLRIDDDVDETSSRQCAACQAQAGHPSESYATITRPCGPWRHLHTDFAIED